MDGTEITVPENVPMTMAPAQVLSQAREAAQALQGVIAAKPKKVIMPNGEQYLEFEDWQTLARFYGYTVETGESEEIWRDNTLIGYKAKATVYNQGNKVGGAEASCMRDETNWKSKPEFQLKSMAQTRAGAKALRNVLAWVAVLAGFKPTPAEEMQEVFDTKPAKSDPLKEWKCQDCDKLIPQFVAVWSQNNLGGKWCRDCQGAHRGMNSYKKSQSDANSQSEKPA